jgi:hypothetical protein
MGGGPGLLEAPHPLAVSYVEWRRELVVIELRRATYALMLQTT